MKTQLPVLFAVFWGAPLREWPRLLCRWFRSPLSVEAIEGFLQNFHERHWDANPNVVQQVCAYVTLTTRAWPRFALGVYVDGQLLLSDNDVLPSTWRETTSAIRAALTAVLPQAHTVSVGLTPLTPLSPISD